MWRLPEACACCGSPPFLAAAPQDRRLPSTARPLAWGAQWSEARMSLLCSGLFPLRLTGFVCWVLLKPPVVLGEVGEGLLLSLPCWLAMNLGALLFPGSWWGVSGLGGRWGDPGWHCARGQGTGDVAMTLASSVS